MRRERDYHWPGSPLEREGGEKTKHTKKENERENGRSTCCSTSDHSSRFSTQVKERGKWRRIKIRERGLLCPCISSLLSALPHPDVAIAKPVGRRESVLGRGLASLGGRRWWSNTWPSHKHEWPLQFNSSWCCLSHGAIIRGTGASWVSYTSYNVLLLQCFTHSFIVIVTEAKNGVSWRKDPSRGALVSQMCED